MSQGIPTQIEGPYKVMEVDCNIKGREPSIVQEYILHSGDFEVKAEYGRYTENGRFALLYVFNPRTGYLQISKNVISSKLVEEEEKLENKFNEIQRKIKDKLELILPTLNDGERVRIKGVRRVSIF